MNSKLETIIAELREVFAEQQTELPDSSILDQYRTELPSSQVSVDIFKGEWSSKFPNEYGVEAGHAQLFEDDRIHWLLDQLHQLSGYHILELGPLEGGHTYMLDRSNAASIISIEANTRAYLKCLVAKEICSIQKATFLCGDFRTYLEREQTHFDLIIASGVLYHMENPVKLIADMARRSKRIFIWTHYFVDSILYQKFPGKFDTDNVIDEIEYDGFKCKLHKQHYQGALGWAGFCGGMKSYSYWMEREVILNCLRHFQFTDIQIYGETQEHPNGPCFTLLATKK